MSEKPDRPTAWQNLITAEGWTPAPAATSATVLTAILSGSRRTNSAHCLRRLGIPSALSSTRARSASTLSGVAVVRDLIHRPIHVSDPA